MGRSIGVLALAVGLLVGAVFGQSGSDDRKGRYLGRYSSNRYDSDSVGNRYGRYGSPYAADGVNNPYSRAGRAAGNPYGGADSPRIYGEDGRYLGRLNSNAYDPESIANPYGRYGSPYSPDSVNNPYGRYGSGTSPSGAANPWATRAPRIYGSPDTSGSSGLPGWSGSRSPRGSSGQRGSRTSPLWTSPLSDPEN